MAFEIVPMGEEHLTELARIEEICFSDPWSVAGFAVELGNPQAVFLLAMEGEQVAGYVGMHHILDEGYIANVAVAPEFRRRGVASLLLSALFDYGHRESLSLITLEVRVSNAPAIALYEKFGFHSLGVRKGFYSKPKEDAYVMTCFLTKNELKKGAGILC